MSAPEFFSFWLASFGLVFAVIDPLGYIPVFLAMTSRNTDQERERMVRRACAAAFVVLAVFTFAGKPILGFFGISIPALQISGGLLLLGIGLEMLSLFPFGKRLSEPEKDEAERKEDVSIVPLAIPMLSGPASIATVVVLWSKGSSPAHGAAIVVSVLITLVATYFALRFAGRILKVLGLTGLNAVTRVMGLLLCAMAVQFVINGVLAVR